MKSDLESVMEECQRRVSVGARPDELIVYLRREGITIIETMKVLKEIYKLSLGEAKELVTAHPAWADEVRTADTLHEELEKALQKEDADSFAE